MQTAGRMVAVLGLVGVVAAIAVWFFDHQWGLWIGLVDAVICADGAVMVDFGRKQKRSS